MLSERPMALAPSESNVSLEHDFIYGFLHSTHTRHFVGLVIFAEDLGSWCGLILSSTPPLPTILFHLLHLVWGLQHTISLVSLRASLGPALLLCRPLGSCP